MNVLFSKFKVSKSSNLLGLLVLILLNLNSYSQTNKKPNILIIIVDDLGVNDLSYSGSKLNQTPNFDQFAKISYVFKNAYANYPRCAPSRFSLMTSNFPVKEFDSKLSEVKDENNFIKRFKKSGYQSFFVGKWHVGSADLLPKEYGFDYSYAANEAGGVFSHFYPFNTDEKIINPMNKETPPIPNVYEDGKEGDYLTDLMTAKFNSLILNSEPNKPFFGILSTYAVHTPLQAKNIDIQRNLEQLKGIDFELPEFESEGAGFTKLRQDNPIYAAMVENMDENLGKIFKVLKDNNLIKNTIVVVTSDHGGLSNRGSMERDLATTNYPLRAGKGHLYEGGIRIPLMISFPNG